MIRPACANLVLLQQPLAYAENIENPTVLAKAVERITTKHVSLDIQPDQYAIVGDNLLHSISEVLNVPLNQNSLKRGNKLTYSWQIS